MNKNPTPTPDGFAEAMAVEGKFSVELLATLIDLERRLGERRQAPRAGSGRRELDAWDLALGQGRN